MDLYDHFLFKATLPSLTNPPSLSPIRRKGKEKEVAEQASVAMSPKKSTENSPGRKDESVRQWREWWNAVLALISTINSCFSSIICL